MRARGRRTRRQRRGAPSRAARLALGLLGPIVAALGPALLAPSVHAQTPDSLAAPAADSLAAAADTAGVLTTGPLLPLDAAPLGRPVAGEPPARLFALDAASLLARLPGTFHYDPGTPGWPVGWSAYALPPASVDLRLDGRPLDDGLTGRPRYDLLPWELLAPLRLAPGGWGAPLTVHAALQPYVASRPYTELRYRSGGGGLQRIAGLHSQNRRRAFLGQDGLLGALFGYVDAVADGEYPGSRTRTRHLALRLRYYGPRWSAEVSELNTLHRAGAQGGAVPFLDVFETIYNRFDPRVENPRARRQTRRNDLAATLRARLTERGPTTLTAYWTRLGLDYTDPDRPDAVDTIAARVDRLGFGAEQTLRLPRHRLRARLDAWLDAYDPGSAASVAPSRLAVRAVLGDSLRLLGADVYAAAGLGGAGRLAPSVTVDAVREGGALGVFALVTWTGEEAAFVERAGFGPYVVPAADAGPSRTLLGRLGVRAAPGPFRAELYAFGHTTTGARLLITQGAVDRFGIAPADTVAVAVPDAPVTYVGAGLDLAWRPESERGLYGTLQPTAALLLDPAATPVHARLDAALPRLWVRARLGARYRLFLGDLDLDLYAEGTAWSALRSRTLHPATGRLALPPPDARVFGPSGRLDLVAEAGVRTATFFVAWENALSGTVITPYGNLVVPVYPLPNRRFRFGIYWPIFG